jgi:hypothetical protein
MPGRGIARGARARAADPCALELAPDAAPVLSEIVTALEQQWHMCAPVGFWPSAPSGRPAR